MNPWRKRLKKKSKASFFSPAKANLFFQVVGKRTDGYHEISSLFCALSFGDILHFNLEVDQDQFSGDSPQILWNAKNLIYQAVSLFRKETNQRNPISIHLEKKIPLFAGLGGGSSNAATTLWALNELFGFPLSLLQLSQLGAKLGSDVPFFFSSGYAFCQGRGEKITPLSSFFPPSFWIIKPPFPLSTEQVFSCYSKEKVEKEVVTLSDLQKIIEKKSFFNDLEASAFQIKPEMKTWKEKLCRLGKVVMTGSGSSFLVFTNKKSFPFQAELKQRVKPIIRSHSAWYPLDTTKKRTAL